MEYTFQIKNEAEASPENARYNCELYIDLNCDGNYSPKTERMKDIEVRQDGMVITRNENGLYELKEGIAYTITRSIPAEYTKLIAWKLVITNNDNTYVRTSEIGYTKRQGPQEGEKPSISVLQIRPEGGNCTCLLYTSL